MYDWSFPILYIELSNWAGSSYKLLSLWLTCTWTYMIWSMIIYDPVNIELFYQSRFLSGTDGYVLNPSSKLKTCNVEELGQFRRLRRSCSTCDGWSDQIGTFSFSIIMFQRAPIAPYNIFVLFSSVFNKPVAQELLLPGLRLACTSRYPENWFSYISLSWFSWSFI